ncbi:MAG: hypothetical protein C5B58_16230 [Acidobacteria bacterium]|nr:MAG: hypothetical protein C5B58_16230 [Acidobacteriota bacterium]
MRWFAETKLGDGLCSFSFGFVDLASRSVGYLNGADGYLAAWEARLNALVRDVESLVIIRGPNRAADRLAASVTGRVECAQIGARLFQTLNYKVELLDFAAEVRFASS